MKNGKEKEKKKAGNSREKLRKVREIENKWLQKQSHPSARTWYLCYGIVPKRVINTFGLPWKILFFSTIPRLFLLFLFSILHLHFCSFKYHAFLCLLPLVLLLLLSFVLLLRMLLYNIQFFHHLSEKFINGLKKRFFYETKMAELKGLETLFEIKSSNYDL